MPTAQTRDDRLVIETDLDAQELRSHLRDWQPWHYAIEFSNGDSTAEFELGTR